MMCEKITRMVVFATQIQLYENGYYFWEVATKKPHGQMYPIHFPR